MSAFDFELVRHALDVARDNQMQEVELAFGDAKFSATLEKKRQSARELSDNPTAATVEPPQVEAGPKTVPIKAASVGIFQNTKIPMIAGATVEVGDVVGSIFALGITNEVHATVKGTLADVLVEDGQPVEFGERLFEVIQ